MFKSRRPDKTEDQLTTDQVCSSKKDGIRQVSEEKNKFALSVLRRVRVKLEGREPDSLRKVGQNICTPTPLCVKQVIVILFLV